MALTHSSQAVNCNPRSAAMQTEAQGQLQAAEVRQKGLKKQLAEQRKALASKEKEAGGLAQDLQKEQRKVDECSRRQVLHSNSSTTHSSAAKRCSPSALALCMFFLGSEAAGIQ